MKQDNFGTTTRAALIRLPNVEAMTGLSRSAIYALQKAGKFPEAIQLNGKRSVAWVVVEVEKWIEGRISASRDKNKSAASDPLAQ